MVGTASLPHILMRYFTTPSVREARISVAWSLFFIFLLYFSAPAYAAFSKLEVYTNLIGSQITALPALVVHLWRTGADEDLRADAATVDAVVAACKGLPDMPAFCVCRTSTSTRT